MGTFLMWSRGDSFNVVQQAIAEQAQTLAFTYGGVADNRPREKLAEKLQQWAPRGMGETRIFFCSGGAEANEAALKLAFHSSTTGNAVSQRDGR